MNKQITGSDYPLSDIFAPSFEYVIPSYQRPYSWTTDNAAELFDDLYEFYNKEEEKAYFLGSIVLIKQDRNPLSEIIDGQQRLTTLTILIALIAYQLSSQKDKEDYILYLIEPGRASQRIQPKPRLSLRDRDKKFFKNYVQELKFNELFKLPINCLENDAQRNIQENSKLLLEKLTFAFKDNETELRNFGAYLMSNCYLIVVSTANKESAFRIFSVLNNRGLDLQPTDIIKADIIGEIPLHKQDTFTDKWENLETLTGRSGFNDLFGHIRMIYAQKKAKKPLIEEFKEYVSSTESSEILIEKVLEPCTKAYLTLKNQQYRSEHNAEKINNLLKWLNRIDNADWLPPAILFLSQKHDPDYTLWFFTKLELLAAYMHLTAKNINQRIEKYATIIKALQKSNHLEELEISLELTPDEKNGLIEVLNGNIYCLTARRRNYLILRLDSFLSDGAANYDYNVLTIEHVLPQTINENNEWQKLWPNEEERKQWTHRIANLVPLSQRKNSQANNYNFRTKKLTYFTKNNKVSSYALTTQVINVMEWTPEIVKERQNHLIEALVKNWELS